MKPISKRVEQVFSYYKQNAINAFKEHEIERSLVYTTIASSICYWVPFGRWDDAELDSLVSCIGHTIQPELISGLGDVSQLKHCIIHMVSDLGGHGINPHLLSTIKALSTSGYRQVVLNSNLGAVCDQAFQEKLVENGVVLLSKPQYGHYESAKWLASVFNALNPSVILDRTVFQAFEQAAISYVKQSLHVPVIRFNLSDMRPMLGRALADVWVEMREIGVELSSRFTTHMPTAFLPLPLPNILEYPALTRSDIGIPEDATLSITIAPYWKLARDGEIDYFQFLSDLLRLEPKHYHIIVGEIPIHVIRNLHRITPHRIFFLGYRHDIYPLMKICDFGIESFPLAGAYTRLDMIQSSLPFITLSPQQNYLWTTGFGGLTPDYPFWAETKEQWLRMARDFIHCPSARTNGKEALAKIQRSLEVEEQTQKEILNLLVSDLINTRRITNNYGSQIQRFPLCDEDYCRMMLKKNPMAISAHVSRVLSSNIKLHFIEKLSIFRQLQKSLSIIFDIQKIKAISIPQTKLLVKFLLWLFLDYKIGKKNPSLPDIPVRID